MMRPRGTGKRLDRALRRLGDVSPGLLQSVRERVRHNLKSGSAAGAIASAKIDASAASLWPVRWPFAVAAMSVLVVVGAIGGVWRWSVAPKDAVAVHTVLNTPSVLVERPAETRILRVPAQRRARSAPAVHTSRKQTPVGTVSPTRAVQPRADLPPPQPGKVALLPPGDGRTILDRACNDCHRATAVRRERFATKAEYTNLVSRMVDRGAPLSEGEIDTLAAYLFEHFSVRPESGSTTTAGDVLERSCTTCHNLNGIEKDAFDTPEAYRELISRMISHGAMLRDEEAATLAQYLFATYGQK